MVKTFRYLFLALLAIVLLTVASANREVVALRLLPTEVDTFLGIGWTIELPLFLVIFAGILAGLAVGFVWEWLREARMRTEASQHRRQVGQLEREVTKLRAEKGDKPDEILALLDGR
ncbi:LapA family protein [Frigidibacter sp. SD6-1]|uniref:LapA family protein n=1 Tax=Frigidibacter sp. SD6-1 TaxID=3032581 RepID=UPI0032E7F54E